MLRPRLCVGWNPSWRLNGKHPLRCEDGQVLPWRKHLVDATRISDGKMVYIKRVQTGDTESQIATMLSTEEMLEDPRNHCVPIIELLRDPDDENISYMVMPFLRLMDDPEFEVVGEIVDFVDQILEGLVFLHENGVAHRDCVQKNLMMDASAMYPHGFHPSEGLFLPDSRTPVFPISRSYVGVKYYFVDFGISVHIPSDVYPKTALGGHGRDQEPPELSFDVPYDPFKLDVFIIGNVFRREFCDKFSNMDFLQPLAQIMTQEDPTRRPTAVQALEQWKEMRPTLSLLNQRWRPRPRKDVGMDKLVYDTIAFFRMFTYFVRMLINRLSR